MSEQEIYKDIYVWVMCENCGAKYYYVGTWSNAHNCPSCKISHEDHYNSHIVGARIKRKPSRYIYPDFKPPKEEKT